MPLDLSRLTSEVEEMRTVNQSAVALINGLAQKVRDTAGDPAAVNALADALDASANEVAAAVTANTEVPPTT